MLVKNEADVLAQTLTSILKYGEFDKIYIFDNGSTDDTFKVAKAFESETLIVKELPEPFSDNLKFASVYQNDVELETGDWFAILDADEIYYEKLRPIVLAAEANGANIIETKSAQFYFTNEDVDCDFDHSIPAYEQRKYYLVNYGEPRIYQYKTGIQLSANYIKSKPSELIPHNQLFQILHFQYRSAEQTQKRLNIRKLNNKFSNNWGHIGSLDYKDYMVPKELLFEYDGTIQMGLPEQVNLYKVKNNAAYTMASLNWMKKHGYISIDKLCFFDASRLKKILRKLF